MKIMVVEDESDIRDVLRTMLELEGFTPVTFESGVNILADLRQVQPDLLLLDHILPGKTGVEIIREVRATSEWAKLPIIMVTGLSGEDDKVNALDLGADDYITKPFYPKELAARIRALQRRLAAELNVAAQNIVSQIVDHEIAIDFSSHRVSVASLEVNLTLTEFKLLAEFVQHAGKVLTRESLRERALGNLNVTDRTVDVHVAALRKKLGLTGNRIQTVRGVGYRLSA